MSILGLVRCVRVITLGSQSKAMACLCPLTSRREGVGGIGKEETNIWTRVTLLVGGVCVCVAATEGQWSRMRLAQRISSIAPHSTYGMRGLCSGLTLGLRWLGPTTKQSMDNSEHAVRLWQCDHPARLPPQWLTSLILYFT
jgi:hypothetical protein